MLKTVRTAALFLATVPALMSPAGAAAPDAGQPAAPAPMIQPAGGRDSLWQISARAFTRNIHRVLFLTGTETVTAPKASSGRKANVGSTGSYADRTYDNGYVRQDAGTASDGTTWYWGYSSAGQIQGDSIVFRAFDGYESSGSDSSDVPDSWEKTDFSAPEFGVSLERTLKQYPSATAGLRLGFSWLSFSVEEEFSGSQFIQNARYIEDTYALYGITPPAAPYSGTYGGPGPILDNTPVSRSVKRQAAGTGGSVASIRESLDVDVMTFDVGFTVHYPAGPLDLNASLGPAFHLVQEKAGHVETPASGAVRNYSNNDSGWIMGYFVEALAEVKVSSRFRLGASGRYDSVSETANTVGPSSYAMDLSGWSAGLVATLEL